MKYYIKTNVCCNILLNPSVVAVRPVIPSCPKELGLLRIHLCELWVIQDRLRAPLKWLIGLGLMVGLLVGLMVGLMLGLMVDEWLD